MKLVKALLFVILAVIFMPFGHAFARDTPEENTGVWVTVFSAKRVLYSRQAALDLIQSCKKRNINEIYLQLYRAGYAYYDSKICDRSKYEDMLKTAGTDTVTLLLELAQKNNIKVFAWMNILSLSQNKEARIIVKYGNSILTRDQHLRPSMRTQSVNESDKYYLRDDQIFIEPGDPRVAEYLLPVVDEIIERYPLLSGVHFDYIRYPYPVPFIPGSRFNKYGLTYGYGSKNIERFKIETGIDPFKINDDEQYLLWDDWKRAQVTALVEKLAGSIKKKSPEKIVSCAVIPALERAYNSAFQDWGLWLKEGIVDHVVLMNYTKDRRLTEEIVKSGLANRGEGKVYAGIGAYLMKDDPEALAEQYEIIKRLRPDGIVFLSCDDIDDRLFKNK